MAWVPSFSDIWRRVSIATRENGSRAYSAYTHMADCVFSKPVNHLLELAATSSETEPDWTLLPDVVLTYIFRCLPDVDRHRMALVCRRWNSVFSNPCLWRYRYFRFGGLRSSRDEAQRAVGFTRKHGHALRHLTFLCETLTFRICKIYQMTITKCLSTLGCRSCRLHTFVMSRLFIKTYWCFDFTRERLVAALARFLKRQTALKKFDMSGAMFRKTDGFKVS